MSGIQVPVRREFISVHKPTCKFARAAIGQGIAYECNVQGAADSDLPHSCMPGGFAEATVIRVRELSEAHLYKPGKLHPVGLKDPLCAICRHTRRDHQT